MTGKMIYLKDVTTLTLAQDQCVGCGQCTTVCPRAVLEMENGRAVIVDRDACMECGACVKNCPTDAIFVETGVGCAAAIINTALGRSSDQCCCVLKESGKASSGSVCGCC